MDIQKEKELYLAELLERGALKQDEIDDLDFKTEISAFHSSYLSARFIDNINFGWSAWQAAKAQAVPEGFVLVPKEPTLEMIAKGHDVFVGAFDSKLNGGQSLHCAYLAMIEAQEQSND